MSHKVKTPKINEMQMQQMKTTHYQEKDSVAKELFSERTKENNLFQQIRQKEQVLIWIREVIDFANKHPNGVPFRVFQGGWAWSYTDNKEEAMKQLYQDQKDTERDIEILKQQNKLAVEKQIALENKIQHMATFKQKMEKMHG